MAPPEIRALAAQSIASLHEVAGKEARRHHWPRTRHPSTGAGPDHRAASMFGSLRVLEGDRRHGHS
jgi:hypothetical protein